MPRYLLLLTPLFLFLCGCVTGQPAIPVYHTSPHDHPLVIRSLRAILEKHGVRVIGEAQRTSPLARAEASRIQFQALTADGTVRGTATMRPEQLPMRWRYPTMFQVFVAVEEPSEIVTIKVIDSNNCC